MIWVMRDGVPKLVEVGQCLGDLRVIKQFAVQRNQFVIDLRQPSLGGADAILQVSEP